MSNNIESIYSIKIDELLANLRKAGEEVLRLDGLINRSGQNQSFNSLGNQVNMLNQTLANGASIYQSVTNSAEAYKEEIARLVKAERELIKAQAEFSNSANYDKVSNDLALVRQRLGEIRQANKQLGDETSKSNTKFKAEINKNEEALNSFNRMLGNGAMLIGTYFGVQAIKNFGQKVLSARSEVESFQIALETMVQSKQVAVQLEGQIVDLAKKTPFTLQDVENQTKKLLAYGIGTKEVVADIKMLGDISAGVGVEKLPQLTLAYGQVRAVGRLMGSELRQFTEAGIPLLETLANTTGKTVQQVQADMSKGKIAFEDVRLALQGMTGEGGKFFNLMEKQSTTLEGLWSNTKDSLFQGFNLLGKQIEGTAKTGIKSINSLVSGLLGSESAVDRTTKGFETLTAGMITYTLATNGYRVVEVSKNLAQQAGLFIQAEYNLLKKIATGQSTAETIALAKETVALYANNAELRAGATALELEALATAEATVSAEAFNIALMSNPIGVIIGLIGIATTAYLAFDTVTTEVNTSLGENVIKLKEEQAGLNALVNTTIESNTSNKTRLNLISRIREQYPDLLRGIKDEEVTNNLLKVALDRVNLAYKDRIFLAQQAFNIEKVNEKNKDVFQRQFDISNEYASKYGVEQTGDLGATISQLEAKAPKRGKGNNLSERENLQLVLDIARLKREQIALNKELGAGEEIVQKGLQKSANLEAKRVEEEKKLFEARSKNLKANEEFIKQQSKIAPEKRTAENEAKFAGLLLDKQFVENYGRQNKTTVNENTEKPKNVRETVSYKQIEEEYDKLVELEKEYQTKLSKIELDANDVRLSMMDKDSKEYLQERRKQDLAKIELEKQAFKELYVVELANELLEQELKGRKGKIRDEELDALKRNARQKAEIQASSMGISNFDTSANTATQRGFLQVKTSFVEDKYADDLRKLEEKNNKEQLDRLNEQTSLLGEGITKQIIMIEARYNALIEKYEKDINLTTQLEIKRNAEIAKARLDSSNTSAESERNIKKGAVDNRVKDAGEATADFEKKNKVDLVEIDKEYYKKKITLLEQYLATEAYLKAVANGTISAEQKAQYEAQLAEYRASLSKNTATSSEYDKIVQGQVDRYAEGWKKIGSLFETLTGKALKFSKNPELDSQLKTSFSIIGEGAKEVASSIIATEIESSNTRLSILDSEISEKESKVNFEFENYKLGLANNFLEERKNLEAKKKERDAEQEHKKKLQQEESLIQNASILGSQAVTVASMVSAVAKTFEAHAPFPFIGIATAIVAIGTMIATMSSMSAKAKSVTKMRYGGKIKGNLHNSTGVPLEDTGIEVEGGEFVNRREVVGQSPDFFEKVNKGTFKNLEFMEQVELLRPLGLNLALSGTSHAKASVNNAEQRQQFTDRNSNLSFHFSEIAKGLGRISDNTSRISEFSYTTTENETLKFNSKGKLVEVIKKS